MEWAETPPKSSEEWNPADKDPSPSSPFLYIIFITSNTITILLYGSSYFYLLSNCATFPSFTLKALQVNRQIKCQTYREIKEKGVYGLNEIDM